MKFNGLLCIVCSIITAVFIGSSEGTITGWTVPVIATKDGSGTVTTTIPESTAAEATTGITLVATGAGTITYTITSQTPAGKLTNTGGELFLATGESFEYATVPTLTIVVTAEDSGSPVDTATATITLNINAPPEFTVTQFAGTIADGSGAGTRATATLSATDEDGDELTYAIDAGDNSQWEIDGNKLKVISGATLDAETRGGYQITVTANDGKDDSSNTATVWIAVTTCNGARAAVIGVIAMIATVALSTLL